MKAPPCYYEAMDTKAIRTELQRIRHQLRQGDGSELWLWVIKGRLACAQRPLRDHPKFGGRSPLPPDARPLVVSWVDRLVKAGFRSIISLLEVPQLERYYVRGGINLHPDGLLGYYRSRGVEVESIPCTDYQKPTDDQMRQASTPTQACPSSLQRWHRSDCARCRLFERTG